MTTRSAYIMKEKNFDGGQGGKFRFGTIRIPTQIFTVNYLKDQRFYG